MVYRYKSSHSLLGRRRSLRTDQTKAEKVLWYELRAKRTGYKFYRQFTIGRFIVDFYCDEKKVIIELDGPIHESQKVYDMRRQRWLENQGYTVMRFKNDAVLFDRDVAMQKILTLLSKDSLVVTADTSP